MASTPLEGFGITASSRASANVELEARIRSQVEDAGHAVVKAVEGLNLVSSLQEVFAEDATEIADGAGYEDFHCSSYCAPLGFTRLQFVPTTR
jgi:hypothetical protein